MNSDQRFSTDTMEVCEGTLDQHFGEYNRCSASYQVNINNESKAGETLTLACSEERCKELNESDRYGAIHSTIEQGFFNRNIDFPDKGEGMENRVARSQITDKWKADEHEHTSTDNCMTGYSGARDRFKYIWQETILGQPKITDKMLSCSVTGELQEITYTRTEAGSVVSERKRVTIHMHPQQNKSSAVPYAKVINLPGSLDQLFGIARKYCIIQMHD